MKNSEMKRSIEKTARLYPNAKVEIDRRFSTVAIDGDGAEFFAQGEDADYFTKEAERASEKFNVSERDALLWFLDSAGAISPPKKKDSWDLNPPRYEDLMPSARKEEKIL